MGVPGQGWRSVHAQPVSQTKGGVGGGAGGAGGADGGDLGQQKLKQAEPSSSGGQ